MVVQAGLVGAMSKWLDRCLGIACATGTLALAGELFAQDFTYTNVNGTITITGYIGPGGDVVIPSRIDGLPVTRIGDGAFSYLPSGHGSGPGLSHLTNVTIPDCVTDLGEAAFAGCTNLASISLGKGITRIKGGQETQSWGTFQWCSSLSRVTIPDNVTNISDGTVSKGGPLGAFSFCTGLTNIIAGRGLAYLGDGTFSHCPNLVNAYFQGNAPAFGYSPDPVPTTAFFDATNATVYYLPGTTGWGPAYAGRPTMLWNPRVQTMDAKFGVRQNQFGFDIAGTPGIPLVIEASADLPGGPWVPLQTCTLTNGLIYFGDPQWTSYPQRVYRIRSP
jgi:BspA type Leucine rich repeat region (6 copies)